MFFTEKGYCRFCGGKCFGLKLDKKNKHISFCKKYRTPMGDRFVKVISRTTPLEGNIKAPDWCPKNKK